MGSTLFTAVIVVGVTGGLLFLFSFQHQLKLKARLAKRKQIYHNIICQQKLAVCEKEEINDTVVAIDKINFLLLHIDFSEPGEETTLTDLWHIKKVELDLQERIIYEPRENKFAPVEKQVIQVRLAIHFKDPSQPKQLLSFYQFDKHGMQHLSLTKNRVEYWRERIENVVKELPFPCCVFSAMVP